mmetsp:Transcript_13785/g.39421  ORF Transcript_13785/g.39421 Transcript_13785/m.39421 type:complete len:218 (+) Transcript_13785:1211-1864(+)
MQFSCHLLILHDGALCRRIELIFCLCLQHLSSFLDTPLHVLLELINLDCLLSVVRAHIARVLFGLLLQMPLQLFKLALHGVLVPLELLELIKPVLQVFDLLLESGHVALPLLLLFFQPVLVLLLLVLKLLLELLDLGLRLLDFAVVCLEVGMQSPQYVRLRLALRGVLRLEDGVVDFELLVVCLESPHSLLELLQREVLPHLLHNVVPFLHGWNVPE